MCERGLTVSRYSREEPFTVLNIDIRNQQNLLESLEQYVKGDLLEGANAYHCEKCNKKVSSVTDNSRTDRSPIGFIVSWSVFSIQE